MKYFCEIKFNYEILRIFRSRRANSLLWRSNFRNFGKNAANIATTMTQIMPPEVTEKVNEVADAIVAARNCPASGPTE